MGTMHEEEKLADGITILLVLGIGRTAFRPKSTASIIKTTTIT
jgi:hypothetical protein